MIQPARSNAVSSSAKAALYGSVVSPVFITRQCICPARHSDIDKVDAVLLLFVSGMPTAEKPVQQRYYLLQHGPKKSENANAWNDYKVSSDPARIYFVTNDSRVAIHQRDVDPYPSPTSSLSSTAYFRQEVHFAGSADV